ncbi:MAG: single-stranded-DNA-specific exonuclease RecJ [Calditerrivibrio sp.]|nr:single-stranded-DNA-specific exonuclease RecJ [Calditerrivibrio sp.]
MEKNDYALVDKTPKYRWICKKLDVKKILDLKIHFTDVPVPILEVLAKRGFYKKDDLLAFLEVPLSNLYDPFLLKDMTKAVKRVLSAIEQKEKICIYGDYDVDGVTATSLLYEFLSQMTPNIDYYIPNRLEEGYSLNKEALDELKSKGARLVITVDCGITSVEEVDYGTKIGLDIIITDHHQLNFDIPKGAYAIINPLQPGDTYPFKFLSGVGVAFKFAMAIKYLYERKYDKKLLPIKSFLDLVALGTIADVVPLIDENRVFVKHGLKLLENSNRPGIEELKKISGLVNTDITTSNIGFSLVPRINAVGRMGNSKASVRLLITRNSNEARWLSEELETENRYRQDLEKNILKETLEKIQRRRINDRYKGIIVYSKNWHPGVIGIIASRLVERFSKPSIVLTVENNIAKGSARSISSVDIFAFLRSNRDILIEFGGHKYAAGLKLDAKNLRHLQRRFEDYLNKNFSQDQLEPELLIDAFLDPKDITESFLDFINKLRPFGNCNPEPVFVMKRVSKAQEFAFIGRDKSVLKGFVTKDGKYFEIIGFNMAEYKELIKENNLFDIAFTIELNNWIGGTNIQLKIKDIKKSS